MKKSLIFCLLILTTASALFAQNADSPVPDKTIDHTEGLWLGFYTKYRLTKKTFYYGEYHYRRRENFIERMAQIYLRFGVTYLLNKHVEFTAGVVTPFYWSPNYQKNLPNEDKVVPQFRFWEQALLVQPVGIVKIYHQFRLEQRWRRDYEKESPFELTWRFRYRFSAYVPINNHKLINKTLYLSAYEEIFFQAGETIKFDHFEDNRMFLGLGYIFSDKFQVQAGYMWTFRHKGSPYAYESRHIPRVSLYHTLDFYGMRQRKKSIKPIILEDNF